MTLQGSLLIAAIVIVLVLAGYAAYLWRKVLQQKQQRLQKIVERQQLLKEQIQQIAKATAAEQCQPAEAALRLVNLLRAIPMADHTKLRQQFPHLHALFDAISDQPILEARKALDKKERRRLDRELEHHQAELGPAISDDIAVLNSAEWTIESVLNPVH